MIDRPKITPEQVLAEAREAEAAIRRAVRDAILDHKRTGDPIVVWRDGKVCWIPADEIVVPDLPDSPALTDTE